jgi:hypothetical protein
MEITGKIAISFKEYQRLKQSDEELKRIKGSASYSGLDNKDSEGEAAAEAEEKKIAKEDTAAADLDGQGETPWLALPLPGGSQGSTLKFASRPAVLIKEPGILPLDVANEANAEEHLPPEKTDIEPVHAPVTLDSLNSVPAELQTAKKRQWYYLGMHIP